MNQLTVYILILLNLGKSISSPVPAQQFDLADLGTPLSQVAGDAEIPITLDIGLNREEELDQFLQELYQPGHPNFHKFLSSDEFHAKYSPNETQITELKQLLEQKGIHVTSVSDNRYFVHANAPASILNSIFGTTLHYYRGPDQVPHLSPNSAIQIPADLKVRHVHGLHNRTKFQRAGGKYQPAQDLQSASVVSNAGGAGPFGGISPSDIRSAYQIPDSSTGQGQILGLFEFGGYNPKDIAAYTQQFNLPNVPLRNILLNGATGAVGGSSDAIAEVVLDIELMIALAPNAKEILVYQTPDSGPITNTLSTFSRMASDNLAKTISVSWHLTTPLSGASSIAASINTIFKQMASQGQTLFVASGDSGAINAGSAYNSSSAVNLFGTQPYAVIVGGTTLSKDSSGLSWVETAWSGSGGGVSGIFSQPSWQKGVANSKNRASNTMRNIPDVSLNAGNGYAVYVGGKWVNWGGTSAAAPLWAAFTALANELRQGNGLGPVGFPNPTLYQTGKLAGYEFRDITTGNNGFFPATQGYDDATGWGSFTGNLLQALGTESLTDNLPPTPVTPPGPQGGAMSLKTGKMRVLFILGLITFINAG